jgi:hypothetical protein
MLTADRCLRTCHIVALPGGGDMGQVFPARECSRDRNEALKVLPETVTTDAGRLAREARALAAHNHPH